jgi:hypothetical protein
MTLYVSRNTNSTITVEGASPSIGGGSPAISITTTATALPNTWTHIAVTRSGSTFTCWINGVSAGTATFAGTLYWSPPVLYVGSGNDSATNYFTGYISNPRIVKGTAVYTSTFTPPTAPLTAISNTSFLLNFTNAGITDATAKNVLETVGDAKISTVQSKFGGSSMYFDGTGDYLFLPSRATTALEGDFTVEFWIYRSAGNNFFFTLGDSVNSSGFDIYIGNSGANLRLYSGNSVVIDNALSSIPFPASAWNHYALVRYAGVVKVYVNGIQVGSSWSSTTTFSGNVYVGAEFYNGSITGTCNGYINDLRITKGIARYTQNFTPPATAFLTK